MKFKSVRSLTSHITNKCLPEDEWIFAMKIVLTPCSCSFLEILYFVEIQSADCLHLQNNLGTFNEIFLTKVSIATFWDCFARNLKHLRICKWQIINSWIINYSSLHNFYKFSDLIWSWNLHCRYLLINQVGQWFHQPGHLTFRKINSGL